MFFCNNVSKSYLNQKIFENFTYKFPEKGFVLLLGESGSGKTTLLNMLAGIEKYDSGEIEFNNVPYSSCQIASELDMIGYIVQDSFFVDYLSVMDNLNLISEENNKTLEIVKDFGLTHCLEKFPQQLSGGEKQRLAIIRTILQNKKILLLDEPTASLDYDNKIDVFELLNKLKQDMLIICSSHDLKAKDYADEILDFHKKKDIGTKKKDIKHFTFNKLFYQKPQKGGLYSYVKLWFSSFKKNRSSNIRITIIMLLTIMALCLGDFPNNKLNSNAEYSYKLNQLQMACDMKNDEILKEIEKNSTVEEVVLNYSATVPDGIDINNENDLSPNVEYDLLAHTLPYNKKTFKLSGKIIYGTYFTDTEQIILTLAEAKRLGEPSELIGTEYTIKMYDGETKFEIVGIFDDFSKYEIEYLWASGINISENPEEWIETYFINNKYMERFKDDTNFSNAGKRTYCIYFSSFKDMKNFYDLSAPKITKANFIYASVNPELLFIFEFLFYIFAPAAIIIILTSIVSYYQILKIEIAHNINSFSVFNYCGYSFNEIKRCWLRASINHITKIILISFVLAMLIMNVFNIINYYIMIIPFQVFTFNLMPLVIFIFFIFLITIIASIRSMKMIRINGWNQMLLEQRDLL